jgi:RHS repeat-associated protein
VTSVKTMLCDSTGGEQKGLYRYGFNGKENDNEVKGLGSQQDYGMRIYDPRVGKFLSVDPLTKSYPMLTPYQYASNNPVVNVDLDGQEGTRHKIVLNGTPLLEVVNLKVYVNVTNNAAYANGIFAGANYENANTIVNELHSYLNDVYNGGKDMMDVMTKPITVNEGNVPVYYHFEVVPIQAANEREYIENTDRVNNTPRGRFNTNTIEDDKHVDNSFEGDDYVFVIAGVTRGGVAMYNQNNEVVLDPARYAARNTDLADFKNDVAHEVGHKFMSRSPDDRVRGMGSSAFLHNRVGGIMNYNFNALQALGGGRFVSIFDPTNVVNQSNTTEILKSVIKIPDVNINTNNETINQ